jgi:hypothetical protein
VTSKAMQTDTDTQTEWRTERYRDDLSAPFGSRVFRLLRQTELRKTKTQKGIREMIFLLVYDPVSFSFFERQGHTYRQS